MTKFARCANRNRFRRFQSTVPIEEKYSECDETYIVTHLNSVADYKRRDRLYPADPRIFSTNPLSLAYGAAGVTYALYKITGTVPQAAVDWTLQHRITPTEYAPGLYLGMAGIAWSLLEME